MKKIFNNIFGTIALLIFIALLIGGFVAIRMDMQKICPDSYILEESECISREFTKGICNDGYTFDYNKNRCLANDSTVRTMTAICPEGFGTYGHFTGDTSNGEEYCYKEIKEDAKSKLYYLIEDFKNK